MTPVAESLGKLKSKVFEAKSIEVASFGPREQSYQKSAYMEVRTQSWNRYERAVRAAFRYGALRAKRPHSLLPMSDRMCMKRLTISRYSSTAPMIAVPLSQSSSRTLFTIWFVSYKMYPVKIITPKQL